LPGVNVVIKGTVQGTVTDINGNYSIDVPGPQSNLVFSSVGYLSEEITVGSRSVINVSLTADITALEEIVIIGFGEKSRKLMTESIGTVGAQEINQVPIASADQAIQGRMSGVQVTAVDGTPGAPIAIRVRGVGTVGNTQPLFVIDGVPVGNNTDQRTNPLATITQRILRVYQY
jgi:TonB-dependent starch-binding outer membrane protein SusC